MLSSLCGLDGLSVVRDDYRVRTLSGAIVTILSILIMAWLFISEVVYYTTPKNVEKLVVSREMARQVHIDFDLSFPKISCSLISVGAIDEHGRSHENIVADVFKRPIDEIGLPLADAENFSFGKTIRTEDDLRRQLEQAGIKLAETDNTNGCGSCYGASNRCCNTCNDVKAAFQQKGWEFHSPGIVQCETEDYLTTFKASKVDHGGCQIFGTLHLPGSSGHFHFVPHMNLQNELSSGRTIDLRELLMFTFREFNISHNVHQLSFGHQYPGYHAPLDGVSRHIEDKHGMYQYYLKVVPTLYLPPGVKMSDKLQWDGESWSDGTMITEEMNFNPKIHGIESNQYSVTEYMSHLAPNSNRGLPGVYFHYEMSPIQSVIVQEKQRPLLKILTSTCALIGGGYVLFGVLDRLFFTLTEKYGGNL